MTRAAAIAFLGTLATPAFAAQHLVVPDYLIPSRFLPWW